MKQHLWNAFTLLLILLLGFATYSENKRADMCFRREDSRRDFCSQPH